MILPFGSYSVFDFGKIFVYSLANKICIIKHFWHSLPRLERFGLYNVILFLFWQCKLGCIYRIQSRTKTKMLILLNSTCRVVIKKNVPFVPTNSYLLKEQFLHLSWFLAVDFMERLTFYFVKTSSERKILKRKRNIKIVFKLTILFLENKTFYQHKFKNSFL